jgi:uncharacterized protein with GYD domain
MLGTRDHHVKGSRSAPDSLSSLPTGRSVACDSRTGAFGIGEGGEVPTYIMLTTLTAEGAHTVHANPDRLTALADEVAKFGCKVVAEYAVLGQYDFVTVVDAPDNETVAHLSVDLGSRGTAKLQTLPAISLEALMAKLKGPDQLGR